MATAVPFPTELPTGYEWFDDEPVFDPERHLALEEPAQITMLTDLGYTDDDIAGKATPVACTTPFRLLTDEGAEIMLAVARRLRPFARPAGHRIERMVRGGCYRSRWLRDLCISPEVNDHFGQIWGIEVAPHAMPAHLGHINYDPSVADTQIDKWHHDTLPLDYVMAVTDPAKVPGGRFEYFTGTKAEAAALFAAGQQPPAERVIAPDFPGPGYAIALHGDMIVHRAAPLTELAERISMVNGYVAADTSLDVQSRTEDLIVVDDHEVLWTEWARFAAWRAQGRLAEIVEELPFSNDRDATAAKLEEAMVDVQHAIDHMRDHGERTTISHY